MPDLTPPVAFVIGGSGTLGGLVCRRLAEAGCDVVIGHRPAGEGVLRAQAVRAQVETAGRAVRTVGIDVADPASVDAATDAAAAAFGRLDILVVASGIARAAAPVPPGDIAAFTPDLWDTLIAVNLRGPFLAARAAAPYLRAAPGGGRIVLVGSTVGMGRWGALYPFAPSKAAIAPLTRYLAATLAPDIAVNCVAPGLMEGTGLSSGASESFVAEWREAAALQRTTDPVDVAAQICAFALGGSATGQTLLIDGGLTFD
ncbi:MAG: SDR family oxidoreductase [Pseudomonadota bacterium]